jgi:hypothetical protein
MVTMDTDRFRKFLKIFKILCFLTKPKKDKNFQLLFLDEKRCKAYGGCKIFDIFLTRFEKA